MDASGVLVAVAAVFETYRPQVLTLVGLIVADVVLGVAAALKSGAFDWQKLAGFYRSQVLPALVGWLGVTIALYLVTPALLGELADAINQVAANALWGTAVASVGASALKSLAELRAAPAVG